MESMCVYSEATLRRILAGRIQDEEDDRLFVKACQKQFLEHYEAIKAEQEAKQS